MAVMENNLSDTYITLRSSAFKEYYPDNSPFKFTNILRPALNLSGHSYEIGLVELYLLGSVKTEGLYQVCCNIAPLRQVGDGAFRTIKILPLHSRQSLLEIANRTFRNVHYFEICRGLIEALQIEIIPVQLNVRSSNVPTVDAKDGEAIITLHIRRLLQMSQPGSAVTMP